jgi:hypothetical protein
MAGIAFTVVTGIRLAAGRNPALMNVNCIRVIRSCFDLQASPDLVLQVGDRVVI